MNKPAVFSGFLAFFACGPLLATQYAIIEVPQLTSAAGLNDHGDIVGGRLFFYQHSSGAVQQIPDAFFLRGINDHGQIIGTGAPPGTGIRATVWLVSGGEQPLENNDMSFGNAINNSGLAVGSTGNFHGMSFAKLWRVKDNSSVDLPPLFDDQDGLFASPGAEALAINAEGDAVGWSQTATSSEHAVRWHNGVPTDLGALPGGSFSVATGINDEGEVVGFSDHANIANHAFLHRRGRMVDLGNLANDPKLSSVADGINDRGEIVGWSQVRLTADNSIAQRAFVYSSGKMLNLTFQIERQSPLFGKVRLTEATAINCKGWIAANGFDASSLQNHAYLLIPRHEQRNNCQPARSGR
jgi:probable HAF family extracellular repeat protein